MTYDIVLHPDNRLRRVCDPVERVDARVQSVAQDMLDTMYKSRIGIGLSGPQVGVMERLLVCDLQEGAGPQVFINPEITWKSEETNVCHEGCLSFPEVYAPVTRPEKITVNYLDQHGAPHEITTGGLLATLVQHEIDHLDGVLFIDHLSNLKRELLLKKYFKLLRIKE